jgi:hypothetical protein
MAMPRRSSLSTLAAPLAFAALAAAGASADPVARTISFPGHQLVGHEVLTNDSFVAARLALEPIPGDPDGSCSIAGSDLVLVQGIDEDAPRATPIPLPGFGAWDVLRLSPTRILVSTGGGILLVDDLGGENRIVPVDVSSIAWSGSQFLPHNSARLADDAALLKGSTGTALLADLGGANTVTPVLPDWNTAIVGVLDTMHFLMRPLFGTLRVFDRSGPVLTSTPLDVLDPYYALVTPLDADRAVDLPFPTEVPRIRLFENFASGPTHRDVDLPSSAYHEPPTRLRPDRILVRSQQSPLPDKAYLIDGLDTAQPTVAEFDAPRGDYTTPPLALGPDRAAVFGNWPGEGEPSRVLVLSDLGGSARADSVSLGEPLDIIGPPAALGDRQLAIAAQDDLFWPAKLVVISDVGSTNRVDVVPLEGGFWGGWGSNRRMVYGLGPGQLLAAASDEEHGDHFLYFRGLGEENTPEPVIVPLPMQPLSSFELEMLGNGVALATEDVRTADPCTPMRPLVSDLPGGLVLRTSRVQLRLAGGQTKLRVTAELRMPRPELFAGQELTVRLGPLSQVIPAARIAATRKGWLYRDPAGSDGWVRRLEYAPETGALRIDGRTPGFLVEEIDPDNFAVSLESRDLYAAEYVAGVLRSRAAPRGGP